MLPLKPGLLPYPLGAYLSGYMDLWLMGPLLKFQRLTTRQVPFPLEMPVTST